MFVSEIIDIIDCEINNENSTRISIQRERFSDDIVSASIDTADPNYNLIVPFSNPAFDIAPDRLCDIPAYFDDREIVIMFEDNRLYEIGGYFIDVDDDGYENFVIYPSDEII